MKYNWLYKKLEKDSDEGAASVTPDEPKKHFENEPQSESKNEPENKPKDESNSESKNEPKGESKDESEGNLTAAQVVELVTKLIGSKDKSEESKDEPKEKPKDEPKEHQSSQDETIREILIDSADVPNELRSILPKDIGKLRQYLKSPEYKQIKAALTIKPKSSDNPEPKAPPKDKPNKEPKVPKTFSEVTADHLMAFDNIFE